MSATGITYSQDCLLQLQANLSPTTLKLLEDIKAWGKVELEPHIPEHWDKATFPPHILSSFRQHFPQLLGYSLPRIYGGGEFDLPTACQVSMTLASIDASFTTTLLVQYGLCAESILLCGTESQRERLLPPLIRLDKMGCFCLTEPQSGSDASNLTTTAVRVPGGYRLTGSKRWIGNALSADVFVVWAKNASLPGNPVMGFILERQHQPPGAIQTSKIHGKVSMRMLQNANVEYNNAFCPHENVMGDYVGFAASVGRVLEASRVSVAWIPVGICMGALDKTYEYVSRRQAFRAPLSSFQLIQEKLVRMTSTVASMYLLIERVTQDFAAGKCDIGTISMAKAHNTRVGREVVAICREVLGGNGIVLDYGIASKFCDMESTYTYEGTYDVCVLVAGRKATGIAAIKSPSLVVRSRWS
ncbi:acyl-CoA dehydrogenase/oxidase, N-terminal and middle domain containing protein [Nitzschia inconspicua]|uniref:Acyl-CoA dehydrogenase/oxidase, N-terminal and middle domain containing protein n=1 Tax=Nitzschia inconspicua TaxID=303405 RepID=A0A9K3L7Y6_9STRA|nr:acyl-CoA dehydrogenase/oxidase, N-terminal and middle domain containing protein [Nitzschia inconspicua]